MSCQLYLDNHDLHMYGLSNTVDVRKCDFKEELTPFCNVVAGRPPYYYISLGSFPLSKSDVANRTRWVSQLRRPAWLNSYGAHFRVKGPRFQYHHGKFGKTPSHLCLHDKWQEFFPTHKKARVFAIMSVWLVHIKEHVWTVRTCPTTTLLMYLCYLQ